MKKFYTVILTIALMAFSASAQLTIKVDNVIEDPCPGGNKGAIETTITGGIPPYDINWQGPLGMTRHEEDIDNLSGGDWEMTVYDSLGALATAQVFVPIASGMLTSIDKISNDRFTIEYVLNGNGNPHDFSYNWEHNGWTIFTGYQDTLTGLGAGDYVLTITDTLGCTDTALVTLLGPEQLYDTVEVIKFLEVADEATLINPVTQATIWVKYFGDYIQTSESFDLCNVYNITGSVVKQVKNETHISVSDLQTGIYIFSLEFGSAEIVQRFLIQ